MSDQISQLAYYLTDRATDCKLQVARLGDALILAHPDYPVMIVKELDFIKPSPPSEWAVTNDKKPHALGDTWFTQERHDKKMGDAHDLAKELECDG